MNEISNYPVDAVITWVDGGDENHQNKMLPFIAHKEKFNSVGLRTRFDQVNEIKFTVDSILKFAKFIRNIYIVTDNQIPAFLKEDEKGKYKNVKIIDHKMIFKEKLSYLPVFNSRSIETLLYKIENLSEHFVYFNDDMFLIKETKLTDFFIKGLPVLRGRWHKFNEDVFYKKLFSKKNKKTKASHKIAQEKGAKIIGFQKYYRFHHLPYSLRKSTFVNFFKANPDMEDLNCKFKFRNYKQFIPQALVNHIEIKNKTCVLKKENQLVNYQNYKKPFFWLKYRLESASKNKNKLFLNMQSLDQCPKEKLDFILSWLRKTMN